MGIGRLRYGFRSLGALVGVGLFVVAAVLVQKPVPAGATINRQINFQGKIVNNSGSTNITDGSYNMEFKIYSGGDGVPGGGDETLLWTESRLNNSSLGVSISNGIFRVNLGSVTSLPGSVDFNNSTLWLSINLGSTNGSCTPFSSCTPDGEMNPMVRFTAAPYAFNSDSLDGLDSAAFGQLAANQTWTGTQTFQPTTNISSAVIKQTTAGSPTADILNVQTANATNIIQITGPAANEAAVTIKSIGATRALTLESGSGTVTLGASTIMTATGALTLSSGGSSDLTIDSASGRVVVATGDFLKTSVAGVTGAAAGDIWYDSTAGKYKINESGTTKTLCNLTDLGCGAGGSTTLQSAYDADVDGSDAIIPLTANDDSVIIRNPASNGTESGFVFRTDNLATGSTVDLFNNLYVTSSGSFNTTAGSLTNYGGYFSNSSSESAGANLLTNVGLYASAVGGDNNYSAIFANGNVGIGDGSPIALLTVGSGDLFQVSSTGTVLAKNSSNSTTSFRIQNAAAVDLFVSDTTNSRIYIGNPTADSTGALLVLDTKNTAGDPTGVNGGMYYNSNLNKFRCYENGAWKDCDTDTNPFTRIAGSSGASGSDVTLQRLTSNSADVTTTSLSSSVMSTTGVGAGTWRFRYTLFYQTAATTTGIGFGINHTGASTVLRSARWDHITTGGAAATGVGDNVAGTVAGQLMEGKSGTTLNAIIGSASAGVGVVNTNILAVLEGVIVVTNSGTLELKIASEVSGSAVRVMSDSLLELTKF